MKKKFTDTVASMKMEDIVKKSDNAGKLGLNVLERLLYEMNDFFNKFVECTDQVMDYNA